ncbi:MAG: rhomboid family intramembrane serine protease [Armatimonadetes bacterium]|nr:rhomboid family intramembrane serine protease [Armatimonadota bacterium]
MKHSRTPYLTLVLIAANLAVAAAVVVSPEIVDTFGFHAAQPTILSAFSSLFVHQNIIHLLGNLVFLAAAGASVEMATGWVRFAIVYFLSGLAGVLAHRYLAPGLNTPLVGASGCIAGCIGYYSARYFGMKVPILPGKGVSVAAIAFVWVVLQVLGAAIRLGGDSQDVGYWAHLGGFACGLVLSVVFRAPDLGQRELGHQVLDAMNGRGPAAQIYVAEAHLKRHPDDPKALQEIARAANLMEDPQKETKALLELIKISKLEDRREPLIRLAEMHELKLISTLERTRMAEAYKESQPDLCEMLLASIIEGPKDDAERPEAMFSLAKLKMPNDPQTAQVILRDLEKDYPLHGTLENARIRGWLK